MKLFRRTVSILSPISLALLMLLAMNNLEGGAYIIPLGLGFIIAVNIGLNYDNNN